jgi:mannosyl-3-phosphoglycerate phosphatase family protein
MNNTETLTTKWQTLIFTDLDGSLLDHFNYEVEPANQVLTYLENQAIPVIFNTSKTFDEVLALRTQLENHHPFIVENGAAIYIPRNYFPENYLSKFTESSHPDYLKVSLCEDRAYWLKILEEKKPLYVNQFRHFHEMGTTGIARVTGLSDEKAVLANRREYSEPILWDGDKNKKTQFINEMRQSGAKIEEGGRFLHLIGHCNKGKALTFLLNIFQQQQAKPILSIALGDGKNDVPMLQVAEEAILIRSPVHPFPDIPNQTHILRTDHYGPHGWAEGITKTLKLYSIDF